MKNFNKTAAVLIAGLATACTQSLNASGVSSVKSDAAGPSILASAAFDICPAFAPDTALEAFDAQSWPAHLEIAVVQPNKLKDWSVDFENQTVIRYTVGSKPSAGFSVSVSPPLKVDGDALTVPVQHISPKPGAIVATVLTSPCVYVQVDSADYKTLRVQDVTSGDIVVSNP